MFPSHRSASQRPDLLLALILAAALTAAGCGSDDPDGADPAAAGAAPAETVELWTAAELAPRIVPLGGLGRVPGEIVVELARPVVGSDQVGKPALDGTVLRLEPPVEGELVYRSPSSLRFVPGEGFAPGSTVKAVLESIATEQGVVRAPVPNPWIARFDVPDFGFLRLALAGYDEDKRRAEVDLHFSAPPDLSDVRRRATLAAVSARGARDYPDVSWSEGSDGAVRATLSGVRGGTTIELELAGGVASRADSDLRAGAADAAVTVPSGPRLAVRSVQPTEGSSGWFLDVVCDDDAVESERWYYDRERGESYGEISIRCVPREDSVREHVSIDPPVPFTVAESSGGFRIYGDFTRGAYTVRLASGLTTRDGGVLAEEVERDLVVPARSPRLSFAGGGRYLPRSAWRSLAVRHLNANRLQLTVRRVPPANLAFWMSDESETATERTSDVVLVHDLAVEGGADELTTSFVDVGSLLPAETRGLIELTLAGTGAPPASARLLLTDLQLVVKRAGVGEQTPQGTEVTVWAVDSRTLSPVRGVDVRLIKPSGTAVATCRTAGEGGCTMPVPAPGIDPALPFALVAETADDLTYLRFQDLRVEVQEERVAGEPWGAEQPYRAALYTDRGAYRPGETAHLAAIVRGEDDHAPPAGLPAILELVDPRGTVLTRQTLATNAAGMTSWDQPFADFAVTGRYEARLEVGDRRVGTAHFQVEELVPERLKVEAAPAAESFRLGERLEVEVDARYLFGGVPADHRVDLSCELVPGKFAPRENADLHYGVWEAEEGLRPLGLGTVTGALDAEGKATLACAGGEDTGGFAGPATMVARAAVFESGSGRTTVGSATAAVHPESFYIGLSSGTERARAGEEVEVRGKVVDWQGRPVAAARDLEIEVLAVESQYGWAFDEALGYDTYRRYRRIVPSQRRTLRAEGGDFRFVWEPRGDAESWVVRVRAAGTRARTDLEIAGDGGAYWWAPWETQVDQTPKPDRPTWVALDLPETVRAGERVTVSFDAPYRGRALIAVETDRMVETAWLDVDPGPVEWRFKLDGFVPNVYVSALVLKDPLLDSPEAFVPDRAYGVAAARVEPSEFDQQPALEVPEKVRSQSRLDVKLALGRRDGPTWATVAVVDEGVLSLTRFESPDPFAAIFARRMLGVETFETVGWTRLAPAAGSNDATGGDQAGELGRVQAVKPVALWSGLVEVPADGRLTVPFELPPYRGELRVMAVTASAERMGRAEARVTVADPIVVQATVPRVLALDDRVEVPVQVTNVSGARRDIEVTAKVTALGGEGDSPVELAGRASRRLTLADGASGIAVFPLAATRATGAARFEVEAVAGDVRVSEGHDLPLVPAAPVERRLTRVALQAGANDLGPALGEWLPTTERTTIWVTSNPYADVFDHVSHLIRYPYGCLEQTASTTRPLLVLGSFVRAIDPRAVSEVAIEDMVRAGIDRILSMQTPSGGFAYWPGGTEPAYWASANAVHLLLDAQKAGHTVPQSRIDDALDWMEGRITSHYERGGGDLDDWYSKGAEPYMHYVLALAGRPRKARIQRLIDELPRPALGERAEHEWMLKAALYLAGDHRYERDLRRPELGTLRDERDTGWTFYSDRRRRGFVLASYLDLFGREGAQPLADVVAEGLRGRGGWWYTTQELVWGLTGLGRFLREPASDFEAPSLTVGGRAWKAVENPPGRPASDRTFEVPRASERGEVVLQVPAKGDGALWAIVTGEGVPVVPRRQPGGGDGLALVRRYLTADGTEIPPAGGSAVLGELVFVELAISNLGDERIGNLALVDRVPAGWEIENPRLGRDLRPEWLDEDSLWAADHMDVRDDRLEVFGHLEKNETRLLVYAVRAVSAGEFAVPAATLEAMYDPRLWAQSEAGRTEVMGAWPEP